MEQPDQIRRNAQKGVGPCEGCSAHENTDGEWVNPGFFDPTSDLVFMTDEPRHATDWDEYDEWSEYNEYSSKRIAKEGKELISSLLEPFDYTIDDIWMGDSIKCPTKGIEKWDVPSVSTSDAFNHCRSYLRDELRAGGDRRLVVALGKPAAKRTHRALDVPRKKADVRVTYDYGHSEFDTTPPVVICTHWAQRTLSDDKINHEVIPVVQDAMADVLARSE
jgi:uracil-DNA glycosylase